MSEFGGERLSAVPVCQWRLIKEETVFVYMTVCLGPVVVWMQGELSLKYMYMPGL
jgi:hypothetical protein